MTSESRRPASAVEIARRLQAAGVPGAFTRETAAYRGTERPCLRLSVPVRRGVLKAWAREHPDLSGEEFVALLEALSAGRTVEERCSCGTLLTLYPRLRAGIGLDDLERWLGRLEGWLEIDCLCQSTFAARDLLDRWPAWDRHLARWAADPHPSRRRASLVLLTGPVRTSSDSRLATRSFDNLRSLAGDRDPLITKAVSWLLRSLTGHHRPAVEAFLADQEANLPAIALRETRTKLRTGRKTAPPRAARATRPRAG